jgi:hypothetical protein
MSSSTSTISTSADAAAKRFDGRVFHAHCDPLPTDSDVSLNINDTNKQWGLFTPDVFIVISSADLMASVQEQLRKNLTSQYKAESVTIQLADSDNERGSEMISANLATRVLSIVNFFRGRALSLFKEEGLDGSKVRDTSADLVPTQAGIRLYPKLPEVKGSADATRAKIRDLAVKYGAIAETEGGELRDVSNLDVTIKVNIFGAYQGKFYLNYRLVAPFRHKDKPEILAEQPKKAARKRAASAAPSGAGAGSGGEPAAKKRTPAVKKEVNPDAYDNEDDLCMAYVKAGNPLRTAAQLALNHFRGRTEDNSNGLFSEENAHEVSVAGGGAGAGSAGMPSFESVSREMK